MYNTVKPRVFVLTDIENEPDDAMSLVRFLVYSNQWDVEGLVATTSIHQKDKTAAWRIKDIVSAYGEVRDNLEKHESGFPVVDDLLSIIKEGLPVYGLAGVGDGKDSSGSELLISSLESEDKRPLWVLVWGGPSVLAQALYKLSSTKSKEVFDGIIEKIRVYTISDQDDSGPWLRKNYPNLYYIASPGFHDGGAYHFATWSGISGDKFHGRFGGADHYIVDNPWLDIHVRKKGPLGKKYPFGEFLMEGDTPTFLYLINNGLGDSEHPEWGSWGGRYELYLPRTEKWFSEAETRPFYCDAADEVKGIDGRWHTTNKATIWRWRKAYQNDFSSRMDWTIKSYEDANHPPVVRLAHDEVLYAKLGDRVTLDAEGSYDPDGDELSYHWFYYGEAGKFTVASGTSGDPITINNADKQRAWFDVPEKGVFSTGDIHMIVAVTDDGQPALTRYRRVIIQIQL